MCNLQNLDMRNLQLHHGLFLCGARILTISTRTSIRFDIFGYRRLSQFNYCLPNRVGIFVIRSKKSTPLVHILLIQWQNPCTQSHIPWSGGSFRSRYPHLVFHSDFWWQILISEQSAPSNCPLMDCGACRSIFPQSLWIIMKVNTPYMLTSFLFEKRTCASDPQFMIYPENR